DREVEIRVRCTSNDGYVEYAVDDNGVGIDPTYASRIFELFRVLESSEGHIGAGLAIAAIAAARLDGSLRCEPRETDGTTFILTLPR
ncbi:MAG: hypothetical protein KDA28_11885, partial [Phycisphaerales bacterium]|nr:hypothetical protein [Phycisphaerales bacterium]